MKQGSTHINPHCKHHSRNCTAQSKNGNSRGLSTVPSHVSVIAQLQRPCCAWPLHVGDIHSVSVVAQLQCQSYVWPSHFGDVHGIRVNNNKHKLTKIYHQHLSHKICCSGHCEYGRLLQLLSRSTYKLN